MLRNGRRPAASRGSPLPGAILPGRKPIDPDSNAQALQLSLGNAEMRIRRAEEEMRLLARQNDEAARRLDAGAMTIRGLECQIQQLRRSTSWRITAPLRNITQAFQRAAGKRRKNTAKNPKRDFPGLSAAAPQGAASAAPAGKAVGALGKTILILDYTVPKPDQDAGSRAMMDLMLCLIESGWNICFWPQDRAPDTTYGATLERLGIAVIDHRWPGGIADWIDAYGARLDHVLISRATVAEALVMPIIARCGAPISFYGHDIAFARLQMEGQLRNSPYLAEAAATAQAFERRLWRLFDQVIYLSEDEANIVRKLEPAVKAAQIVPFWFDRFVERLEPPPGQTILFVAGFAHAPNTDAAEFLVHQILPLVRRACPEARLALVGSRPNRGVLALAGPGVEVTGWVSDAQLAARYDTSRVAVVPLRFGAGVKGKVVQALQQGLPLVTTPVGAQGIAKLEEIVPVQAEPAAIAEALIRLLQDDATWQVQSRAQIAFAETRYSRAAMRDSVLRVFGTAVLDGPLESNPR